MKNKKEILNFLNENVDKLGKDSESMQYLISNRCLKLMIIKDGNPKTSNFKESNLKDLLNRINIDDEIYLRSIIRALNNKEKRATKSNIEKAKDIIRHKLDEPTKKLLSNINKHISNKVERVGISAIEFINEVVKENIVIENIDDEIYIEVKKTPKVYLMEIDKSELLFKKTTFNKLYSKAGVELISEEVFAVIALKFLKLNKICLKKGIDISDYVTNIGDIAELGEVARLTVMYLLSSKLFLLEGVIEILLRGDDL